MNSKEERRQTAISIGIVVISLISIWFIVNGLVSMVVEAETVDSDEVTYEAVTMITTAEPTSTPSPIPTSTPSPTPTSTPTPTPTPMPETPEEWYDLALENGDVSGPQDSRLTAYAGVYQGPSGRETYYNLNMNLVVSYMRNLGYSEEDYPYWVREDGCKMLGNYIIVAANLSTRPKGTILETSLGTAIVCDTGSFVSNYPNGIDIAVNW